MRPLAPLKPMACYLADESSLTFYADAFDVDWAPNRLRDCVAGYAGNMAISMR